MLRKTIAVALVIVLTVLSAGCGKDKKEKQYTGKKWAVSVYLTEEEDGVVTEERRLLKEYEYLGTESTLKEYNTAGEVVNLTKCYYDATGEHLLKEVTWGEGKPTGSCEYDTAGRIIRESVKLEHPEDVGMEGFIDYPSIYSKLSKKEYLHITGLPESPGIDVAELITEYVYFGDSDRLKSVRSVTGKGVVVASFEMGDEDIVISGFVEKGDGGYEETYDPDTNTGLCTWRRGEEEVGRGTKNYDAFGRCVSYIYQNFTERTLSDTYVVYDDEGFRETTYYRTEDGDLNGKEEITYNKDGREIRSEHLDFDDEGKKSFEEVFRREYHANGECAAVFCERWDDEKHALVKFSDEYYDENGELTDYYNYSFFGEPDRVNYEKHIVYTEDPDVNGKVRCETTHYYVNHAIGLAYDSVIIEGYYVGLQSDEFEDDWYRYREIDTRDGERTETLLANIDPEGHVLEIREGDYKTSEFDLSGRLCKETRIWFDEGWYTIYEYEYREID